MYDEPEILTSNRRHVGRHGAFLVVEYTAHMETAAKAIQRRDPVALDSSGSVIEPRRAVA